MRNASDFRFRLGCKRQTKVLEAKSIWETQAESLMEVWWLVSLFENVAQD